ncbi:MAG: FeoB-associated Cys-rich membrane protein [Planctomycetes bacterium]|nr:FeoB-associated Cys-rich membrane protein [Planctomycetota bacterium]MCD7898287.1 FeoB-associated Cys-rich membrane protein [Planctomycetaceae bacterium]
METVITVVIVAAAGFFFLRWFRGTARGEGGCGCGCTKGCGGKCDTLERQAEEA